jgi:hypothetical protein
MSTPDQDKSAIAFYSLMALIETIDDMKPATARLFGERVMLELNRIDDKHEMKLGRAVREYCEAIALINEGIKGDKP